MLAFCHYNEVFELILTYKRKGLFLARSFRDSSLGGVGPVALGLWGGSTSWQEFMEEQNHSPVE